MPVYSPGVNHELAIVTGATAGIGEATARALARENVSLVITGRRHRRLLQLARELGSSKVCVTPLCFDISNEQQVHETVNSHRKLIESADVLVNNAGLAKGWGPLQNGKTLHWNQMIDTNLKGLLYMLHAVLPAMVRRSR